jgi:N-acetylmuramoyl-L-alanine amidase
LGSGGVSGHGPALIRDLPSPNHGPRRGDGRVRLVVIHHTAMPGGAGPALDRLRDPAAEVSCHYVIGLSGEIWRLVPEERRAWHAGAGRWGPWRDVNSASLGLELVNDGGHPYPAAQMDALEGLLGALLARHRVPPEGVIGHSDCAPGRKADPGPRFDWRRLARSGLAVWPGEAAGAGGAAGWEADAERVGYPCEAGAEAVLGAVRLRFRPGARGPADARDAALLRDLARRFPVDGAGARA